MATCPDLVLLVYALSIIEKLIRVVRSLLVGIRGSFRLCHLFTCSFKLWTVDRDCTVSQLGEKDDVFGE